MGAIGFETTATGKSAKEAYKSAVDDALYEFGHDGYNGTISTTNGYRMYSIPEQVEPGTILKLIRKDLGLKQAELGALIGRSGGYISKHERGINPKPLPTDEINTLIKVAKSREPYSNYRSFPSYGQSAATTTKPKLYEANYSLKDLQRASEGLPTLHQMSVAYDAILEDPRFQKWGDCACIKVGENKFSFIGWAAC